MTPRPSAPLLALVLLGCSSSSTPPATGQGAQNPGSPDAATRDAGKAATQNSGSSDSGTSGGDTWDGYAQGFVQQYCVSCHGSGDTTGRDFTVEANVRKALDEIRCGVAVTQDPAWNCAAFPPAKQFPIGSGPKPSDAERDRFVAWITAGAP